MTILTSESRLVGSSTALLPRVNLLPPEIAEGRTVRRIQVGLGAALAVTVFAVGAAYVAATHSVTSATDELAVATATQSQLQSQVTKLQAQTAIYGQAEAARVQLATAMGDEVRFSQMLNDLSLTVPGNVWLKNLTYNSAATPTGGIGTMSVTATAFAHDDVASWLEAIAGVKAYANPYFANSTEGLLGTRQVVNFTATADVTSKALSNRYNKPAGG